MTISYNNKRTRRGFSSLYVAVVLLTLTGMVALAVDWGRVQLARAELQTAADAAAWAATYGILVSVQEAEDRAVMVAANNTCDGREVVLDPDLDITFGVWDRFEGTFTPLEGYREELANAIRISVHRTAERNGGIPMTFARLIGRDSVNLSASAIASFRRDFLPGYGIVGIDSVTIGSGGYRLESAVASNGPMTFHNNARLWGNIHYNENMSPPNPPNTWQGEFTTHEGDLHEIYPPVSSEELQAVQTVNDNHKLPSGYPDANGNFSLAGNITVTMTSGVYYFNDFKVVGNSTLKIEGKALIYVAGDVDISGTVESDADPRNFRIRMATPGTEAKISGNSDLYTDLYAPESTIIVTGSQRRRHGRLLGKTVSFSGGGEFYTDERLFLGDSISRMGLVR